MLSHQHKHPFTPALSTILQHTLEIYLICNKRCVSLITNTSPAAPKPRTICILPKTAISHLQIVKIMIRNGRIPSCTLSSVSPNQTQQKIPNYISTPSIDNNIFLTTELLESYDTDTDSAFTPNNVSNTNNSKHKIMPPPGGSMEDMGEEEDALVEARPWSEAWYEFCLTSPVRGLRQVTETTPFTIRRIVWLAFVLGGVAIFSYQILNCLLYYRSWPVSIDVKLHYNHTLNFPAVTICNNNAFRMTVAAKNNWYTGLSQLYTGTLDTLSLRSMSVANVSAEKIHQVATHQRHDLILSCTWGQTSCAAEDFRPTPTPQGMCYTFNAGRRGESVRTVSGTGSSSGLRLLVNIEQYEYMPGPSEPAGVSVVVHDQQVAPLLPEHAILVSPGQHTAMALSLLQVRRVKQPYGKCSPHVATANDVTKDITMHSMTSCLLRCKAMRIRKKCHCSDFWFPSDLRGGMKVCDIKKYQECVKRILESEGFSALRCECTVPCHEQLYSPMVSHASLSRLQEAELLASNLTRSAQPRYLRARETAERTVPALKAKNTDLVTAVSNTLEEVSFALERVDGQLEDAVNFLENLAAAVRPRIVFHQTRALKGVKYITQHNFIKGWDVMNERTLDHVTTEFYETVSAFDRTISQLQQTPEEEETVRRIIFFMMDRDLSSRLEIAIRAVDNLTKAYYAYLNAEPLLEYVLTPNGRYDLSLIPAEVLAHNTRKQREYYNKMSEHLTGYIDAILGLQYVLKEFHRNQNFNESAYSDCKQQFVFHAKQVNYYKSLFEQRIVHRSKDLIELKVEQFDRIRSRFYSVLSDLRAILQPLQQRLREQYEILQADLVLFSQMAKTFLSSDSVSKRQLASMAHSQRTFGMVNSLRVLFADLRQAGGSSLTAWWERLQAHYTDIWRNFLKEPSVRKFYAKLKDDVVEMVKNPERRDFFLDIFADARMLHTTVEVLNATSVKNLTRMLNADFPDIGFKHKENDIIMQFNRIEEKATLVDVLGNTDSRFFAAFDDLDKDLREYTHDITINRHFVRENLLRLDFYFRDLSSETVEERPAYNLTQLLSDIGGSLALFLGASALTILEFIDFFLHTGALKCYVNRCGHGKKAQQNKRSTHHHHPPKSTGHHHHYHQQHNTYDTPTNAASSMRQTEKINMSPRPRATGASPGGRTDASSGGALLPPQEVNSSASAGGGGGGGYDGGRVDSNKYMPRVAVTERSVASKPDRALTSGDTAV